MIALTTPYLWYTTRATGVVAMILFTLVVSLGTLVANRIGGTIVGRFELNELHRSVSIVAIVFLVIHILTTVLDSYVPTGLISVFVPMTSAYRRIPIALGAVGLDLILAVWISSLLKVRIANQTWRFIHWFSWLGFTAALVHGFLAGTDTRSGVGLMGVVACAAVVAAAAVWRFLGRPTRAAGRTALSPLAPQATPSPASPVRPSSPRTSVRPSSPPPPVRQSPSRAAPGPFPRSPQSPGSRRTRR